MTPEEIAAVCHEVNRGLCVALGDYSQPNWSAAPDWQRHSCIEGVLFHLWNPDATPEQSHERWMSGKRNEGWVYGSVKDPVLKTHPCMRPYGELPIEQRLKDHLFKTVVNVLAEAD